MRAYHRRRNGRRIHPLFVVASLASVACRGCEESKPELRDAGPRPSATTSTPVASASAAAEVPSSLWAQIEQARRLDGKQYVPPTDAELEAYALWARSIFGAVLTDALPGHDAPPGFVGRVADSGRFWLLGEEDSKKRGAGLCVLRTGRARPFLIEAPHTFFDRGTLDIALLAFERLQARALLVNTMRRYGAETKEERVEQAREGESRQDVAHVEKSFYSSAHSALTRADPELVVIQVHGFKDSRVEGVDVVVSASRTRADARAVVASVRGAMPGAEVRLFPDDIDDLGGTKNRQAELSRAARVAFLHLEISATFRNRLKDDPKLARRFVDALGAARRAEAP